MIRNISFLLIVLIVSSCGTLNSSRFSKRKHLKGHFWNLKKNFKNSNSESNPEDYSVSNADIERSKISVKTASVTPVGESEFESSREELEVSEDLEELGPESIEDVESSNDFTSTTSQRDDTVVANEDQQLKENASDASTDFALYLLLFLLIVFWLGVAGLVVTLFLQIFSTVIPWLFYASLIAVVVPLLVLAGIVLSDL